MGVTGHDCGKPAKLGVLTMLLASSTTLAATARWLLPAPAWASTCKLLASLTESFPAVPR